MAISEPGDPPAAFRGEPGSASGKVEGIADARRLLTINTGSSSLKAALYRLREDTTETVELRAEASRIGGQSGSMRLADDRGETLDERRDDLPDHAAAPVRERVCEGLEFLGIRLDTNRNAAHAPIISATAYSRERFEDPPEISNWTWTP